MISNNNTVDVSVTSWHLKLAENCGVILVNWCELWNESSKDQPRT